MTLSTLYGQTHKSKEREVTVVLFEDGTLGVRLYGAKDKHGAKFGLSRKGAEILCEYLARVLAGDCKKFKDKDRPKDCSWRLIVTPPKDDATKMVQIRKSK